MAIRRGRKRPLIRARASGRKRRRVIRRRLGRLSTRKHLRGPMTFFTRLVQSQHLQGAQPVGPIDAELINIRNFTNWQSISRCFQMFRVWKFVVKATPSANQSYLGNGIREHAIAVYYQDYNISASTLNYVSVCALPNAHHTAGTKPISTTIIPKISNIVGRSTTGDPFPGSFALINQFGGSSGYLTRPLLNTGSGNANKFIPAFMGFLYAHDGTDQAGSSAVTVNFVTYAYVTFYGFNPQFAP